MNKLRKTIGTGINKSEKSKGIHKDKRFEPRMRKGSNKENSPDYLDEIVQKIPKWNS